jgi:hypothetical protein
MAQKNNHQKTLNKRVTTIGKGKNSRPSKKKCKQKNGVKKYRGQGT